MASRRLATLHLPLVSERCREYWALASGDAAVFHHSRVDKSEVLIVMCNANGIDNGIW